MDRRFVPAEYELPDQDLAPKQRWLPIVLTLAIICGASLALVAGNKAASLVSVPVSD